MVSANLSKTVLAVAATMLVCGCPTMPKHYLPQPEGMAVQGTYVHPPSKVVFPESVAGLKRVAVSRYDVDGLDVSAGYNCLNALHPMKATVYAYPAPPLVSIGSPPNVVAGARAHLTEEEFERRKQEVQHAHPGAKLISQSDTTRTEGGQSYPGKLAIFEYEDVFFGTKMPVRSQLYVFCFVGGKWAIQYRLTYPKDSAAHTEVQEFIRDWSWYGPGN